jgi:hypothetical protein
MIFSFHVGLTDSVMQRMQFFFLSVSVRHFLATSFSDLLFFSNTNILYCFHGAFELTPYVSHKIRFPL